MKKNLTEKFEKIYNTFQINEEKFLTDFIQLNKNESLLFIFFLYDVQKLQQDCRRTSGNYNPEKKTSIMINKIYTRLLENKQYFQLIQSYTK